MSKLIETVALTIGGLTPDYCNPCTMKKIIKCKDCLETAKEVLEALKNPTPEMIEAGEKSIRCGFSAKYVFRDMIERGLKE